MNAYMDHLIRFVNSRLGGEHTPSELPDVLLEAFKEAIETLPQDYARQDMDAEDAVQNGRLAVMENWDKWLIGKGESFEAFMTYKIFTYTSRTFRKDYDHAETDFSDHSAPNDERYDESYPERKHASLEDRAEARLLGNALEALDKLTPEQRESLTVAKVLSRSQKKSLKAAEIKTLRTPLEEVRAAIGEKVLADLGNFIRTNTQMEEGYRYEPAYEPVLAPTAEILSVKYTSDNGGWRKEDSDEEIIQADIQDLLDGKEQDGAGQEVQGVDFLGMQHPLVGVQLEYRPQWKRRTVTVGKKVRTHDNVVNDWETTEAVEGYIEQGVTPAQVDADIALTRDDNGWTEWQDRTPVRYHEGYWHDEAEFKALCGVPFALHTSEQVSAMRYAFVSSLISDLDAGEKYRRTGAFKQAKIAAIFRHYGPDAVNHLAYIASRPAEERKPILITKRMGSLLVDTNGKAHSLRHLADWAMLVYSANQPDEVFVASLREKFPNSQDAKKLCRRIEQIRLRDFRQRHLTGVVSQHEAVDVTKIMPPDPERYIKALCLTAPAITSPDVLFRSEEAINGRELSRPEWAKVHEDMAAKHAKEAEQREQRCNALVKAREAQRRNRIIAERTGTK